MSLINKHCVPCEGGTKPLTKEQYAVYLPQVENWKVINENSLEREFIFKDFSQAITFINEVATLAESEGHHPDIFLHAYKKVTITLSTHAIGGLSINDFVLAVKIDEISIA